MSENLLAAFLLTLFAGLSTGIGSLLAVLTRRTSKRFLSAALGFSAGVMIYLSFTEILTKAREQLAVAHGDSLAGWVTAAGFFGGIFLIALIDRFVPSAENPHEVRGVEGIPPAGEPPPEEVDGRDKLMRMGVLTALAITIHNFPEGLATFTAALESPELGLSIAAAVAIHNIPEGISVAVPIYYATGSRKKAFWLSFLSGLSEPLGALLGYLVLRLVFSEAVFGVVFASVGGIMVFISLDELLPAAREYGEGHLSIYGLILGMALMALSLLLLQ